MSKSKWLNPVEFRQDENSEPMSKEQVEDEVLEAVKEAYDDEPCCTAISPELYALVTQKSEKTERTPSEQRAIVKSLRKADDVNNKTCAKCMKRLPLEKFRRLKLSEVCQDCEE